MAAQHTSPLQALLVDDNFDGDTYAHEPMSHHTTYRIGGDARFYVRVNSTGALTHLIEACDNEEVPWIVVGRGSNLLVADEGFDGVVITLGRDFRTLRFDEERGCFLAGGGVLLSAVVQEAFQYSLSGLEFAVGTPGTLGGALRMNAGSRDEWIGAHVSYVSTYTSEHGFVRRAGSDIEWGYRTSSLSRDEIVLECEIAVKEGDPFFIRAKMEENLARRKKTQPLDEPSCGSVFRNPPEGPAAAELIDRLGLKGTRCGDAQISSVHANFIVNTGHATAHDVCTLITMIKTKVYEAYGIELYPEVRFLGFD